MQGKGEMHTYWLLDTYNAERTGNTSRGHWSLPGAAGSPQSIDSSTLAMLDEHGHHYAKARALKRRNSMFPEESSF